MSICCKDCGGEMIGDGFTVIVHCENAEEESFFYDEPDSAHVFCGFKDVPEELDFN